MKEVDIKKFIDGLVGEHITQDQSNKLYDNLKSSTDISTIMDETSLLVIVEKVSKAHGINFDVQAVMKKIKDGQSSEESAKDVIMDDKDGEKKDDKIEKDDKTGAVQSLGTVKTEEVKSAELQDKDREEGLKIGYKNMPMVSLPSEGKFYPADFKLSFRAASFDEIKHYSSMDENDILDVNEKIGTVLNSCMRITFGGKQGSFEDLKEFDKIYMLFAIRDLSMFKHHRENKIFQELSCSNCGENNKKEIENDSLGYFSISDKVMKYYDEIKRGFTFKDDAIGEFTVYIPSIGTLKYVANYIKEKEIEKRKGKGGFYDRQFLTFLQFLVPDWRLLNEDYVAKMYREYSNPDYWSYDKGDFMIDVAERINVTIKPTIEIKCSRCGRTSAPLIFFRRGYRSILSLSDVAERFFS